MTTDTLHPLAADYLERLRRAGRGLPRRASRELLAEVEAHLSEAIDPNASDVEALTVLEKLGDPNEIIAAETRDPDELPNHRGTREWAAIILLLFGGFIFAVGWIVGLVLLWSSRAWTTRDKWIGTLVIPGGLATGVLIGLIATGAATKKICRVTFAAAYRTAPAPDTARPRAPRSRRLRTSGASPDRDLALSRPPRDFVVRHARDAMRSSGFLRMPR